MSLLLKKEIAGSNQLNPPVLDCVEKHYQSVSMIRFYPWQEAVVILPYSRLDAIRHVDEDAVERVELSFSHHRVIAIGENLRKILEWLCNSQVLYFRSMPAAHRASLDPTDPFISHLEVQLLADLKDGPATNVPF